MVKFGSPMVPKRVEKSSVSDVDPALLAIPAGGGGSRGRSTGTDGGGGSRCCGA
jgi:hypothetical protein